MFPSLRCRFDRAVLRPTVDRLAMRDGFSYAYTPQIMMAWVTDSAHWGNGRTTSLSYRMLSSMQGWLGIGANLNRSSAEKPVGIANRESGSGMQIHFGVQAERAGCGMLHRQFGQRPHHGESDDRACSKTQNVSRRLLAGILISSAVCGHVFKSRCECAL
jgi:hypothetical protein